MEINVKMSADEFMEFMEWKKDRNRYRADLDATTKKWETFVNKVCWALEDDPKRPGKAKITDQKHAAELLEMAKEFFD